ncbi:hypothetical protein Nepgr_013344 [Nepenthes gracilis]|uniref:Pentatricopeptide repeat-containing protein n=1 Tax=Nepenthes gracilis TaxID=150966 RepID=A0AAD3XNW9_NEPGR|nr:hypothetical protein Nepgr_013344 [Nepenthes gracilis]
MYCKCGDIKYAWKLFDRMLRRDVVSWTSVISAYCSMGKLNESIVLFERMKMEGLEPNEFTWHALMTGYAKGGDCHGAFAIFCRMTRERLVPDLVTWNALISGFARSNQSLEAVKLFGEMLSIGIRPNHVTVTGLLPACGLMHSLHKGREIHSLIYRFGLETNVYVASALVDMYSRCGSVKDAMYVFEAIPVRNVTLWNVIIGCCGRHGLVDFSIELFERMLQEGFRVNEVTLACVLSACSHGGLVEKGLEIFRSMQDKHRIVASKEHYACVVDLLCRSGRVEDAYELVKNMSIEITESIVGSFFSGCKIHGRRDLAKQLAQDLQGMDLERPGGLVTLSNMYAADGEWEEVGSVRKLMKDKGVNKKPGFSSVTKRDGSVECDLGEILDNVNHGSEEFLAG